ncbi:MAG: ATP-binding cassette domain-containing protein [Bdellovibrionota bacterium]
MNRLIIDIDLPLDAFDLQVALATQKKVTGIFGPSGSGKTSLMEVIAGLRTTAQGKIIFAQKYWQDSKQKLFLQPEKRGIGLVPQQGLLFPHYDVMQNITAGQKRYQGSAKSYQKHVDKVVALLELAPLLHRHVRMISGGERQRIALARALCSSPSLILMDEPLTALDHQLRQKILPFLQQVRHEFDIPMILISHDPKEIKTLCDDMIVLHKGKVTAMGHPELVFAEIRKNQKPGKDVYRIPFTVIAMTEHGATLRLGTPASSHFFHTPFDPGEMNHIEVNTSNMMISLVKPDLVTGENILAGTVLDVQRQTGKTKVLVDMAYGIEPLTIEIAIPKKELSIGMPIYLIVQKHRLLYTQHKQMQTPRPISVQAYAAKQF